MKTHSLSSNKLFRKFFQKAVLCLLFFPCLSHIKCALFDTKPWKVARFLHKLVPLRIAYRLLWRIFWKVWAMWIQSTPQSWKWTVVPFLWVQKGRAWRKRKAESKCLHHQVYYRSANLDVALLLFWNIPNLLRSIFFFFSICIAWWFIAKFISGACSAC